MTVHYCQAHKADSSTALFRLVRGGLDLLGEFLWLFAGVSSETAIKGDSNASVSVACPAGTVVISGGARGGFYQVATSGSYRSGNGWHVDARSSANNDTTLTAYAYCLTGGTSN